MSISALSRRLDVVICLALALSQWTSQGSSTTTNVVRLSNTYISTFTFTNTSSQTLTNVVGTNTLPTSFTFVGASASTGTVSVLNSTNPITLLVSQIATNQGFSLSVTSRPTVLGYFTNPLQITVTNFLGSNAVVSTEQIVHVVSAISDIAVGVAGPSAAQVTGDYVSYTIGVTNKGPDAAPNVVLSNYFGLGGRVVSLSSAASSTNSTNLVFQLGTLSNNASAQFKLILELSTNQGTYDFISAAYSVTNGDAIASNDCSTNRFTATNGVTAVTPLVADPLPATVNTQTGLFEQKVTVSNIGATPLESIRLTVAGLTLRHATIRDILYNAMGTNQGNPYVVSPATLAAGDSIDILLEFFFPTRVPATGLTYTAIGVPAVSTSQNPGSGTAVTLTNWWTGSAMFLEFTATPGQRYTIFYSPDTSFTNASAAQPTLIAPGDRVQWVDSGPPKTSSPPSNSPARYYRVIATP